MFQRFTGLLPGASKEPSPPPSKEEPSVVSPNPDPAVSQQPASQHPPFQPLSGQGAAIPLEAPKSTSEKKGTKPKPTKQPPEFIADTSSIVSSIEPVKPSSAAAWSEKEAEISAVKVQEPEKQLVKPLSSKQDQESKENTVTKSEDKILEKKGTDTFASAKLPESENLVEDKGLVKFKEVKPAQGKDSLKSSSLKSESKQGTAKSESACPDLKQEKENTKSIPGLTTETLSIDKEIKTSSQVKAEKETPKVSTILSKGDKDISGAKSFQPKPEGPSYKEAIIQKKPKRHAQKDLPKQDTAEEEPKPVSPQPKEKKETFKQVSPPSKQKKPVSPQLKEEKETFKQASPPSKQQKEEPKPVSPQTKEEKDKFKQGSPPSKQKKEEPKPVSPQPKEEKETFKQASPPSKQEKEEPKPVSPQPKEEKETFKQVRPSSKQEKPVIHQPKEEKETFKQVSPRSRQEKEEPQQFSHPTKRDAPKPVNLQAKQKEETLKTISPPPKQEKEVLKEVTPESKLGKDSPKPLKQDQDKEVFTPGKSQSKQEQEAFKPVSSQQKQGKKISKPVVPESKLEEDIPVTIEPVGSKEVSKDLNPWSKQGKEASKPVSPFTKQEKETAKPDQSQLHKDTSQSTNTKWITGQVSEAAEKVTFGSDRVSQTKQVGEALDAFFASEKDLIQPSASPAVPGLLTEAVFSAEPNYLLQETADILSYQSTLPEPASMTDRLRFITYLSPDIPVEVFELLVHYLEEVTGVESSLMYESRWRGPPQGKVDPFTSNIVDIAFMESTSFLRLVSESNKHIALCGAGAVYNHRMNTGRPVYYTDLLINARNKTKYKELHDLRGHSVAFSSVDSLSASIALLDALKKLGFDASFFANKVETGSHLSAIENVMESRVDLAAVDSNALAGYLRSHPYHADSLEVISSLGPLPSYPIVLNTRLPESLRNQITKALLDMSSDRVWMKRLAQHGISGFVPIDTSLYSLEEDLVTSIGKLTMKSTYY